MELTERIHLNNVRYLNSISYEQFASDCEADARAKGERIPKEKDVKGWYSLLQKFCSSLIRTGGEIKRVYHFTQKTRSKLAGRLYCGGSLQSIWNVYRGFLMRGTTTDIDQKNSHPVLLKWICNKHGIKCSELEYYISHRDQILAQFESKEIGKCAFLVSMNSNKRIRNKTYPPIFDQFDREMKEIQTEIAKIPEYREIEEIISDYQKARNYQGSFISRVLHYYENEALGYAIHAVNARGIEIASLMFDGLLVYGDHYADSSLLAEIESVVESNMPGLNMKWTYKAHDNSLHIPQNFDLDEAERANLATFEKVSTEFEKTHAKIIKKGYFISTEDGDLTIMTKQHLTTSYEHLTFSTINRLGVIKDDNNLIRAWTTNNPNIRMYDDIGIYPKDHMRPHNHFNMWIPFAMEAVEQYEHNQEGLDFIRNHILIICNHEESVAEYVVKWLAQMIQYPERKSTFLMFISKQGAGKGSLLNLITKMVGQKKVLETAEPAKHVWGEFNGGMVPSYLVYISEFSYKDTMGASGKMKALITDPTLMINIKGVKAFSMDSYHRFIGSTNDEEPMLPKEDDRRYVNIACSNELLNNKEYFEKFNDYLDDVNVIKTFYEYLKSIPDMDKFHRIPIPRTEYHRDLTAMARSPIEQWIEDLVIRFSDEEFVDMGAVEMLGDFNNWCSTNEVRYSVSSLKLAVRVKRLGWDGIETLRRKTHNLTRFSIDPLKKSLGIGCLVSPEIMES